jgi:6-phosphogluconolactonase (cycloisomerase 2 family)
MVARARLCAVFFILFGLFSPVSSRAQSTLTVVDNEFLPGGPGDVDFVPGQNDVVTMSFTTGEMIISRQNPDGTIAVVGRIPAGPEPRAVAFAHRGELAVIANSIANELGVFEVGDDGMLREINRVPSGGLNPYDVAVGFDDIVVVANRDSDQINTFHINRRGRMTPLAQAAAGIDPHVVSVSSRGFVGVANQTDQSVSLFELNRRGELTPLGPPIAMSITGSNPPASMTPRTLVWQGRRLYVALDAPFPAEDVIRTFWVSRNGQVFQAGDTAAGFFLTDLEANADGVFAVTVNVNNRADPNDDRDEVRFYRREGTALTLDAAVQTPGVPPSFKQITARRGRRGIWHVLTTEFQGGWMRSLIYDPPMER